MQLTRNLQRMLEGSLGELEIDGRMLLNYSQRNVASYEFVWTEA